MDDHQYRVCADKLFEAIEKHVEMLDDDYDCQRNGAVLVVEHFGEKDDRNRIIINLQPFRQEIWLAAPCGAFHFKYKQGVWSDTRDGVDFFKKFSSCIKNLLK